MLVLVCADVIATKFFNYPIVGTVEMIEELMVVSCFLAFGYTQVNGGHLGVTFITSRLPKMMRKGLSIMGSLISIAVMGIILWENITLLKRYISIDSIKQVVYYFPLWPTALFMVIGSSVFILAILVSLVRIFSGDEAYDN